MNIKAEQIQNNLANKTEFKMGQIVPHASNPSISGAIGKINLHLQIVPCGMAIQMLRHKMVVGSKKYE